MSVSNAELSERKIFNYDELQAMKTRCILHTVIKVIYQYKDSPNYS